MGTNNWINRTELCDCGEPMHPYFEKNYFEWYCEECGNSRSDPRVKFTRKDDTRRRFRNQREREQTPI